MRLLPLIFLLSTLAAAPADFPMVSDDLEVKLFAREPLVRNPWLGVKSCLWPYLRRTSNIAERNEAER